jgi:Mn2+/Fe2+ NRAMP family transporter
MKDTEYMDYKVDLKQTFYANFFWLWMITIVICFIILAASKLNDIKDETIKLLFLIVWCFTTVKLLNWMGAPIIRLKKELKK